jgi:hypothetical protein
VIYIDNVKKYCSGNIEDIEGYKEAIEDKKSVWVCHHRFELCCPFYKPTKVELIEARLYYNRPPSELIFMTKSEHMRLHMSGKKFTDSHKENIRNSLKGRKMPAELVAKNAASQEKVYIRCVETNEVHYLKEWKRLGYGHVGEVSKNGGTCKGKHFQRI